MGGKVSGYIDPAFLNKGGKVNLSDFVVVMVIVVLYKKNNVKKLSIINYQSDYFYILNVPIYTYVLYTLHVCS